jgi:hypothetical protein
MNTENEPLRVSIEPDPDLKLDADGDFKVPTYDVAPEDKHIADAILAMDPVTQVPSPFSGFQGVKAPELTLASLPPEMRGDVERQLAHTPPSKRAETERELVRRRLGENSKEVRLRCGVGEGALPIHQVAAELEANHRFLSRDFDTISEQLAEVVRYDMRLDQTTGERVATPVYLFEGLAREKLVQEQARLNYRMSLLEGIEGQRQMQKALQETVALIKQRNAMVAEEAAVQAGAEKLVREQRLQKRIEARARSLGANG